MTAPAESGFQPSGPLDRFAKIVTEVLSPGAVVLLLPPVVAWNATHTIGGTLAWGLIVAVFSSVLPMAYLIRGARAGRWDGHHVRNREGRLVPLLVILGSTSIGLALLVIFQAPWDMISLNLSMVASLVVMMAITHWWKISLHAGGAAGAGVVVGNVYAVAPWAWVALAAGVVLVSWSRVRIRDHTTSQVVVGAIVGAVLIGGLHAVLR